MLGASAAAADAPPLVLDHLTTEDGLPQATVMTTLQDSQGFVWLGTEDGLVRFDGRELYRYARSRTEPGSLPGNYVWQVVEDADTNLWIALNDAGRREMGSPHRPLHELPPRRERSGLARERSRPHRARRCARLGVDRHVRCRRRRARPGLRAASSTCVTTRTIAGSLASDRVCHADARPCRRRLDRHGRRAQSLAARRRAR